MNLKPQDVVVLLKLLSYDNDRPSYAQMGEELFLSPSEVHASIKRAKEAHLIVGLDADAAPNKEAVLEFIVHGLKYSFPPERGELARGMPTSYAAEPLKQKISLGNDPPPVWPSPEGTARGYSLKPLYKTVPKAAQADRKLYELLALVDAIRDGRVRDRQIAEDVLRDRLSSSAYAVSQS
jgi:DNA-binding Lrp family transcriptional regulator